MQAITSDDLYLYSRWFMSVLEPIWHPFKALPDPKLTPRPDLRFLSQQYHWRVELAENLNISSERHLLQSTNLLRLLVEAAVVMTPAAAPFNDFRAGNAALRYAQFFQPTNANKSENKLILNSDPALRSIRLRGLMAEELALGVAAFLARQYFNVVHIADYKLWQMVGIDKTSIEFPDLACLNEKCETVLLESKGSISSRPNSMNLQRKRAAARLLNTQIPATRVIIATSLLHNNHENESISFIEKVEQEDIDDADGSQVKTELSRLAFAKIFRMAGLDSEADDMVAGVSFKNNSLSKHFQVKLFNKEFVPIGMDAFNNLVMIDLQTLNTLKDGKIPGIPKCSIKGNKDAAAEEKLCFALNDSVLVFPSPVYFKGES